MNAVELLRSLVALPSESGREDAVVDCLEKVFCGLGWTPRRNGRNLHAFLGESGPLLLLDSHTDTVPAGEGWSRPPLSAAVENGRVYGRGANDAKGCLSAMILGAARAYAQQPPACRVCMAATCEEEITGQGLGALLPLLPKPDAAVVGEPTNLAPAVAQKGLLVLTVRVRGRSAHAAWGGGVNAVHAAARDILALAELRFEREHPLLGRPTLQVTQAHGGERHNVIPDRCDLTLDIRTTPDYSPDEIVECVRRAVKGEVDVRSKRLESVATEPSQPVVRAALAARPGTAAFGSPTVSDWVFLKDVPTVKVGPGDSRRSHTPDEYLEIAELEEGVLFYERLIRNYASLMSAKDPAAPMKRSAAAAE
ncbi:MAG: M20/M25/M40 family metallo-hydrolase [Elusimicrobiota bacterium]|jgi:acetylornithine deacetylase